MPFFEAIWNGEIIGDGNNLEEALNSYLLVEPDNGDWQEAFLKENASPQINLYTSFDDYLDNSDPYETISITTEMISKALDLLEFS